MVIDMFGLFDWIKEKERNEEITLGEWLGITGFSMFLDEVKDDSVVLKVPRKYYEYWKRGVGEPILAYCVCNESIEGESIIITINASWESKIDGNLINTEIGYRIKQQLMYSMKTENMRRNFEDDDIEKLFKIVYNALFDAQAVAYAYYLTLGLEPLGDRLGVAVDALREIEDRFWKYQKMGDLSGE